MDAEAGRWRPAGGGRIHSWSTAGVEDRVYTGWRLASGMPSHEPHTRAKLQLAQAFCAQWQPFFSQMSRMKTVKVYDTTSSSKCTMAYFMGIVEYKLPMHNCE